VHGEWPNKIDHIDGVKINNRIANLRPASDSENSFNSAMRRKRKGVRGVTWDSSRSKWAVQCKAGGKVWRKRFDDYDDAVEARRLKAIEMHGEFASELRPGH
jgi:hypothetical protein